MTRHGPDPEWNKDRGEWVYEWISQGGTGMLGCQYGNIPDECLHFVLEQYDRFKIPFPKEILDVARVGGHASFHWADVMDPYCLFWGCSDVDMTGDWATHTYELFDLWGHKYCKEADPEFLETFAFIPGQCEHIFNECLAKPGLEALPNGAGLGIRDLLDGSYNSEECWDGLDSQTEQALKDICNISGIVDQNRMIAYFELAAWASFVWLAGPLGRQFRMENNLIINTAMTYGEALLIEGSIISPENFRKIPREPQSCYRCGVPAWCVELTQDGNATRYICSHCASEGMARHPLMCGNLYCKYATCPHNPFHAQGAAGVHEAARRYGQLNAMARQGCSGTMLRGETPQQLLSSG